MTVTIRIFHPFASGAGAGVIGERGLRADPLLRDRALKV